MMNNLIQTVRDSLEIYISLQETGSPDWHRGFVHDSRGCSIARISFYKGKIKYIKNYIRGYQQSLCETDWVMMRLTRYLSDYRVITKYEFMSLVKKAKYIVAKDLEEKKQWRLDNPSKKSRRKLKGKNIRPVLAELIYEFERKTNDE